MDRIKRLTIWIFGHKGQLEALSDHLRGIWHDWAPEDILISIHLLELFMDEINFETDSSDSRDNAMISYYRDKIIPITYKKTIDSAQDAMLLVSPQVIPGPALHETLQRLMDENQFGWWFSIKPPTFYLHNLMVIENHSRTYFTMDGVFSYDPEKKMFFNHITEKHFLNSQDAPHILQTDGKLCFINLTLYRKDNPMPYEFNDMDYTVNDSFREYA